MKREQKKRAQRERMERYAKERQRSLKMEAPTPNNMGATSSQIETGGVDTLEVSLYGSWDPIRFDSLRDRLEAARRRAEQGLDSLIEVEGETLAVSPVGVRHHVFCRYKIEWRGCVLAVVDSPLKNEKRLSVHVRFGSLRLMEVGHLEAWRSLRELLACLGFQYEYSVVGRIDICVDLPDVAMSRFEGALKAREFICRAQQESTHSRCGKLETYTIGSENVRMRIYDKAREVAKDPIKQKMLIDRRWGKGCDDATRVEFQLRRKAIKEHFSLRSVESVFDQLGTIASWCHSEWFRLVEEFDRDNKHHSRAVNSKLWQSVQYSFVWTGVAGPRKRRVKKFRPVLGQLLAQASGVISSIAAGMSMSALEVLERLRVDLPVMSQAIKEKTKRLIVGGVPMDPVYEFAPF